MKNFFVQSAILCAISPIGFSAFADKWDARNDPARFDEHYNYTFSVNPDKNPGTLPLKAVLPNDKMPWSSSYWPRNKGSINYRWNTPHPTGFDLYFAPEPIVKLMSRAELEQLSPAEKFDLAQGHYDYPLANAVKAGAKKDAKHVEGICDGWAASSIQFLEPAPKDYPNPQGLKIPFGTSDLKALMSYDVSLNQEDGALGSVLVGDYCLSPWGMKLKTPNCVDINPGSFHVILANEIGLKKQSFIADVDPKHETWNQPVFGFEFEVVGSAFSEKAPKAYRIHAKMSYAEDEPEGAAISKVFHWKPVIGTDGYTSTTIELDYILELNYSDQIIGGEWDKASLSRHPDLFWKATNPIKFTEEFKILNDLVTRRANSATN